MPERDDTAPGRTVVYGCVYVPAEWIAAHGFTPWRVTPSAPAPYPAGMGVCPYAAAYAGAAARAACAVYTTACDQMRRMVEAAAPDRTFLMHAPATWTDGALSYYREELARLGRFLTAMGGAYRGDAALRAIMREHEAKRALLREPRMDNPEGPAVALVGGPLFQEQHLLLRAIRGAGARIAFDATESGLLAMPQPADERMADRDPLGALAAAYFAIPHPGRRPDGPFHEWLAEWIRRTGARGIVGVYQPWCDIWHGQMEAIRERAGLPMAVIGGDGGEHGAVLRAVSRIEALVESL